MNKNNEVKKYAEYLLIKCGCNLDCYKGTDINIIKEDLKSYYEENPNELDYPIDDVATYLREIGDEQPDPVVEIKKYCVVYDTENTTDSALKTNDFEEARGMMLSIYEEWLCNESSSWSCDSNWIPHPTEDQIESWDRMIENCTCWIAELNEHGEYYNEKMDYHYMSDEDAYNIDWLCWEELKKKNNW